MAYRIKKPETQLLGVGLYTRAEAAQLVQVSWPKLNYWVEGYSYRLKGNRVGVQPPVVKQVLPEVGGQHVITFLQLMELRIVSQLVKEGFHLSIVRNAAKELMELYGSEHPFAFEKALHRLRRDRNGKRLYVEDPVFGLADISGSRKLYLPPVVKRYLEKVEFDKGSLAVRWWPLGTKYPVIVDRMRSFGTPICEYSGVPTYMVHDAVSRGEREDEIADWYDVTLEEISAAYNFEETFKVA